MHALPKDNGNLIRSWVRWVVSQPTLHFGMLRFSLSISCVGVYSSSAYPGVSVTCAYHSEMVLLLLPSGRSQAPMHTARGDLPRTISGQNSCHPSAYSAAACFAQVSMAT